MKRRHTFLLTLVLGFMMLVTSATIFIVQEKATCTGSSSCPACKNCKYCKHCAKNGGTCGVCR